MARPEDFYMTDVHYPGSEEGMIGLRKRMGQAYSLFIKDYILSLPICDTDKNRAYSSVAGHLRHQSSHTGNDGV